MRSYWPLLAALASSTASAQLDPPAWTRATDAFPITRDIWYVGSEGLAAYLVKTPRGAILLDGTMRANVPSIERNIAAAGVKLSDVKFILISHAHFDHADGVAALAKATGARVLAGRGDVAAMRTGIPPGETSYGVIKFPAVPQTQGVSDGARIALSGTTLTAIATPGHTPGCTSYRMTSGGKTVLFACSLTVAGNKLVGNARYPTIVRDFRYSFARMARERADIMLPFHPEQADLIGRHRRGEGFVQARLLAASTAKAKAAFEADLAKQQGAAK
jgi:metallo-beta-lactamase class B